MALSNTLNTNEIKNSAGTGIAFQHLEQAGRKHVFAQTGEAPALQHRLTVSHVEIGSGINLRRRSMVRIDKDVMSTVDTTKKVTISSYNVTDSPVGALLAFTEVTNVVAELLSFCASKGASTTILYDGTGNGADCLINGSL